MLRAAGIAALLAGALPLHAIWRLLGLRSPWPQRFLRGAARIVGARARVIGAPRERDVVFVANHVSWVDIPLLAGASGCAFVAKAELAGVPAAGWLCRLNDTVFVRRDDRLDAAAQVGRVRVALAGPRPVAFFPEGTTGDGVTLLPFKATLFAALDPPPPGLLVQPVRIDYDATAPELPWTGDEPGPIHARRVLSRPGTFGVTLRFLEPFNPVDFPGRKALAAEARRRIAAAR